MGTLARPTTAPPRGRATTPSTFPTAASSTSTTGPTTLRDTSPRSPTTDRPSSLTLLPHLLPMLLPPLSLPLSLALLVLSATLAEQQNLDLRLLTPIFISYPNKLLNQKK